MNMAHEMTITRHCSDCNARVEGRACPQHPHAFVASVARTPRTGCGGPTYTIDGDGAQVAERRGEREYDGLDAALASLGATEVSDRAEAIDTDGRVALECASWNEYLVYASGEDAARDWDGGAPHLAIARVEMVDD